MRTRGVTMLELLVVAAMIAVIVGSITRAYMVAVDYDERIRASREESQRFRYFEEKVQDVLQNAYVTADGADLNSYFIAGEVQGEASSDVVNSITFTTLARRLPATVFESEADFETINSTYGPQGGTAEVTLGMVPIANQSGADGLFLREQRPGDGDPTQGGYERLLVDELADISFEFFDGLTWVSVWDTREMTTKRLPSAIRVTYTLEGEDAERVFLVRLPYSDVTPQNPLTIEGGEL